MNALRSFPEGGVAIVVGAAGGIGKALTSALIASSRFEHVIGWSRHDGPTVDLTREDDIIGAADSACERGDIRLVLIASGVLSIQGAAPERSLNQLDPRAMMSAFEINAIGPALVAKHLLHRFPRTGKAVFAALSARVGSIGDNRLGGWYSYRASKAALNQIMRTAAVELARRSPDAICLSLHPGTVETELSRPFARTGLSVQSPEIAAERMLQVIEDVHPGQSGSFLDHHGVSIPW